MLMRFKKTLLEKIMDFLGVNKFFSKIKKDEITMDENYIISPVQATVSEIGEIVNGFAKSKNKVVFQHSDGYIYPIIGDLIDIGCDILHPVQPEVMDIYKLKKEFGKYLTFCGGISTQHLLVKGKPEEIREEVRRLKSVIGENGGYIVSNGITIQADVPLPNIVALIEEGIKPLL